MLCSFLLFSKVNQLYTHTHIYIYIYIYISPLFWISFPFRSRQSVEFPVPNGRFSLVTYLIHSSVYMSTPISQFILPPIFPSGVYTFVLCASVSALKAIMASLSIIFPFRMYFFKEKEKKKSCIGFPVDFQKPRVSGVCCLHQRGVAPRVPLLSEFPANFRLT